MDRRSSGVLRGLYGSCPGGALGSGRGRFRGCCRAASHSRLVVCGGRPARRRCRRCRCHPLPPCRRPVGNPGFFRGDGGGIIRPCPCSCSCSCPGCNPGSNSRNRHQGGRIRVWRARACHGLDPNSLLRHQGGWIRVWRARNGRADTGSPPIRVWRARNGRADTGVPLEREALKPFKPKQRHKIRVQAGVFGSGLMAQNVVQSGQAATHIASMMGSAPAIQTKSISGGATTFDPSIIGRNKPATTQNSHRQSARLGVGVKVNFLPHWGLESGLTFTTLNSTFETTRGNSGEEWVSILPQGRCMNSQMKRRKASAPG